MEFDKADYIFNLLYLCVGFFLIYPPAEFRSNGLTIENLFKSFLGDEDLYFIQYHINRSTVVVLFHSIIPIFYFVLHHLLFENKFGQFNILVYFWNSLIILSLGLPVVAFYLVYQWSRNNWENHPISQILKKYDSSLNTIAQDINNEYRRSTKIVIRMNSISKIIATDNWLIKTSLYFPNISHQSDTVLIADKTYEFARSVDDTSEPVQYVSIQVKPIRQGVPEFAIRIISTDFKLLQDRLARPIEVLQSVKFHATIIEKFIEVFREEVDKNPRVTINTSLETCYACMINPPNVKLNKNCFDEGLAENQLCGNCYCSPMWCLDCMARWFAARQDQYEKETWLQKKCSCPMCRTRFCIRDVSYIDRASN